MNTSFFAQWRRFRIVGRLWVAAALTVLISGAPICVQAEFVISGFSGLSLAEDSDLRVRQAGGTSLLFHDVSFTTKDFESPIYYGARLAYFLGPKSPWGF